MRLLRACLAEWLAMWLDPASRLLLGAAVIVYTLVFPVPYLHQLARELPVIVVDQDASALSRRLTRFIDATEQIRVAGGANGLADATAGVRAGDAFGLIVLPAGLERSVQRGERAVVGVFADATAFMGYSQLATGASQAAGTLSAGVEIRRLQAAGSTEWQARRQRDPLPIAARPLFNPSGGYGNSVVPASILLVLQQTLLVGICTLAGSRRQRSQLPAYDPITSAGRGLAYVTLYTAHAAICYSLAWRVYGLQHACGSLPTALAFLLPFLCATVALGFLIARLFADRDLAIPALLATSLPIMFVSGFSWPAEAIPRALHALAQLIPSALAMPAALRVLQMGASLTEVRTEWLGLWLLAAGYFALSLLLDSRASAARTGNVR